MLGALVVAGAVVAWGSCDRSPAIVHTGDSPVALAADSEESIQEVPDFALTERSGKTVTRADLAGKVWVAGFVFTRCTGPCPKVTANMKRLQDMLAGTDAKLVTFTVDPDYDTPEVLASYANAVGARADRWWMLTGPKEAIDALTPKLLPRTQRAAPGEAPIGQQVAHQTRLCVVDGAGRIRGIYSGEGDEHLALIVERVKHLEAATPSKR